MKGVAYQANQSYAFMRKTYTNFECRVRISSSLSDPYIMDCGIHQGGILSLLKYVAFTNALLKQITDSQLCITIRGIKTMPIGYADDLSTACISKDRLDRVLKMVYAHSTRWRYQYNAEKRAVLTYGESKRENENNKRFRHFKLGTKKVPEKELYDHLGTKAFIHDEDSTYIDEKLSKGRKSLNMCTGIGFHCSGINMACRNLIFWTIVVPTALFGSELWFLSDVVIQKLEDFQKYAGRRVQRFSQHSASAVSYYGLGWMSLHTFVLIKKMMFAFTIINMDEDSAIKKNF